MPQEFQVVQCSACLTFQVDIVKKTAKWKCKICGTSQNIATVYLQAEAKKCREAVQNFNLQRGRKIEGQQQQQLMKVEDSKENIKKKTFTD